MLRETAEARAQKARLEAELAEKEEDLQDTVYEHSIELSQDALDELKESLQDAFDEFFTDLSSNLTQIEDILEVGNTITEASADAIIDTLDELLEFYGIDTKASGVLTAAGYASGTKSAKYSSLAKVEEFGPELIIRRSTGEILRPVNEGDAVIPTSLTENLFKWGELDPAKMVKGHLASKMPVIDVSAGATINQNYDSLINVEGNVDGSVITDLQAFAQQFYEGSYEYSVKKIVQDARKVGIKA